MGVSMRKREREITTLYGITKIRDDILKHPYPPEISGTDKAITAIHFIACLVPTVIVLMMLVALFLWSSQYL